MVIGIQVKVAEQRKVIEVDGNVMQNYQTVIIIEDGKENIQKVLLHFVIQTHAF